MISLHPLGRHEFDRVAHLAVRPDQLKFSGSVEEAFATPPESMDLHEIRDGDRAVGIFKIDRDYWRSYNFAGPDDLGLRGVILDAREQGRGLGTKAMAALASYIPAHYPQASNLFLTVNLVNPAAYLVYLKAGFLDEGGIWPHGNAGPQHIMRMALTQP